MWTAAFDKGIRRFWTAGPLTITYADGTARRYGPDSGTPLHVTLHDPALPRKLLLDMDMGFGEAWVDQRLTIEQGDLRGLLIGALNSRVARPNRHPMGWLRPLTGLIEQSGLLRNSLTRARANVQHHYDLSGQLYDLFLDSDRQYSCAYFSDPDMSLDAAQEAKKHHIARKLHLSPGMRVLDIGCGWGGMALTLARDYGAHVTGVTLSREQHQYAVNRVQEAGLTDQIDIRLQDYRHVTGPFDRIVSVGMFEHVGAGHYAEFFGALHRLLTPQGVALLHTIGTQTAPRATSSWLRRYIFPGGYLPALSQIVSHAERANLPVADVEPLRLHYAQTLRHWHDRFMANRDAAQALYDDRFCRMWDYYLTMAELSFSHERLVVYQVQFARDKHSLPLTRDYIYPQI